MEAIKIRTAIPNDVEAVEDYHHRCFTNTYSSQLRSGEFEAPDREGTRQQLRDWFRPESGVDTWVAAVDGVPIGHFTVCGHQLVHLFVEPEHQGRGLGRYLLARGEAMIAADGHTHFELHARVENTTAIAFYQGAGWTVTDRQIHTVEHGISYTEHVLVKQHPATG